MELNDSSKFGPAQAGELASGCGGASSKMKGMLIATDWYAVTMAEFAGGMIAGRNVDRPVIDETGLTGRYDIHLECVPYRSGGPAIPATGDAEA